MISLSRYGCFQSGGMFSSSSRKSSLAFALDCPLPGGSGFPAWARMSLFASSWMTRSSSRVLFSNSVFVILLSISPVCGLYWA